jgi:pimeloyl-ACP methyl ester carboxylesterase
MTSPDSSSLLRELTLHGHRVAYRMAGEGPALVLVHGITSTSQTWDQVMPVLAEHHTVIAPDLLGHGESAKPRGDYSLGAYASGVRDLLVALGHEHATFVGHSLGGGVAMQLAYQFPERCERLVLVDSGGLGRELSFVLRAATVPGSEIVLPLLASAGLLGLGRGVGRVMDRVGLRLGTDLEEMARGHASLADPEARAAFVHTLRAIVDPGGQRVNATDRLYLAAKVPTLLLWGERDSIIPVEHGRQAHALMPGSRLEVFPRAGHFPHRDDPLRFVRVLADFIASTEPARVESEEWREMLRGGSAGAGGGRAKTAARNGRAPRPESRARSSVKPRSRAAVKPASAASRKPGRAAAKGRVTARPAVRS